jgi:hypothetical protein
MRCLPLKLLAATTILLLASSITAQAQYTGALHSARPLDESTMDVGAYLGIFDGERGAGTPSAAFGQARYGLFPSGDAGLKFGLVDRDDGGNTGILLAGDMQWALLSPNWGDAFWFSFGPEISLYDVTGLRVWGFAGNLSASYDFDVRARRIAPYMRLTVRLEAIDADRGGSDTDLQIGLNPGLIWEAADFFDFVGELQMDDNFGFLAGLNFKI